MGIDELLTKKMKSFKNEKLYINIGESGIYSLSQS
jgi:hypothetical protein